MAAEEETPSYIGADCYFFGRKRQTGKCNKAM